MSAFDDGGSAFPIETTSTPWCEGMTLRDWFAGQALPAVIRQCAGDLAVNNPDRLEPATYFARKSYECADAMIAARKVKP